MMVSEMLWVGRGPEYTSFGPVTECATAQQAIDVMDEGRVAVVPTTDIAKEALLMLGVGEAWAAYATQGTTVERDVTVDL